MTVAGYQTVMDASERPSSTQLIRMGGGAVPRRRPSEALHAAR